MTNAELIAHLQTLPLDAVVVYSCWSETTAMDVEQVTAETMRPCGPSSPGGMGYMRANEKWWQPGEPPELVTVIAFPGN